jgi:thiol-disulfide isomerase/thioredoxin
MTAELHKVFEDLPMKLLNKNDFDSEIMRHDDRLKCVFFWGHNCPNCEIAKRNLNDNLETIQERGIHWYHVNVYDDSDLGTRFGLHGIPVFIFFKNGRGLGRITSFPGMEPFLEAIDKLK